MYYIPMGTPMGGAIYYGFGLIATFVALIIIILKALKLSFD